MALKSKVSTVAAVRRTSLLPQLLIVASGLMAIGGCTERPTGLLGLNLPPTIEFTHAPISSTIDDPAFYAYRVFWSAYDPDGRVDHVDYCVDPAPGDTTWVRSDRSDELIFFSATEPETTPSPSPRAHSPHVLAIRAVDHVGDHSPVRTRAFYSWTVAPSVQIVAPTPSKLLRIAIPPSMIIHWQGQDPDGQVSQKPVSYRHRLIPLDDKANEVFLIDPDSLRRRDAPSGFADWGSSGAETTFVRYTDLAPSNQYLFAVVAFDEAGAYSPVFSLEENILQFQVTLAATMGPRIHVFSSLVDFTYESGGYTPDPARWIPVEAALGEPVEFNWDAITTPGSTIDNYRWALDLTTLTDDTPRADEELDYKRWTRRSPLTTSCILRGLTKGQHLLYIEATDNNGYASLGVVQIKMVEPTFDQEILIVDDTRMEPDKFLPSGCPEPYKLGWPSASELDTLLYARGGVPWRCTQDPSSGVLSVPGVFAGYSVDTLGTRLGLEVPSLGVPLSVLSRYRHVVWFVDLYGATNRDLILPNPMAALRFMSTPGRASPIGAYLRAGGRIWMAGGGAGTVSIEAYNVERNDLPGSKVYSGTEGELAQGRLLWDGAHWRSAMTTTNAGMMIVRAPRAEAIADAPWSHEDAWTRSEVRSPDYRRLPAELRYRTPGVDPLPPTRQARQASSYYNSSTYCEYLLEQNHIVEDVDLGEEVVHMASTLDTLLEARSVLLHKNPAPAMTWYHGAGANRFVFTGFAPWAFNRDDFIAITDFVLQDLWGLSRSPVDRRAVGVRSGAPAATVRRAGTVSARSSPVTAPPTPR